MARLAPCKASEDGWDTEKASKFKTSDMDAVGFLMDDAKLLYLDEIDCDARNVAVSLA